MINTERDPKGEEGAKKTPLHLIPPSANKACANVLKLGAKKYGAFNWRYSDGGVEVMTYLGAMKRHIDAYLDGEDIDPESGESHIAHVMAGAAIVLDADAQKTLVDNRPDDSDNIMLEAYKPYYSDDYTNIEVK